MSKLSRNEGNGLIQIGTVTTTHSLKGEVKIFPLTDDVKRFDDLKEAVLIQKDRQIPVTKERVKYFKNLVIVKFREFNDISEVEGLRGAELYVNRDNAVALGEDEYFETDLIGLDVYDEDDTLIGSLNEVIHTGANDVYSVKTGDGKELLIPAIKQCILDVDTDEGRMMVHLLEGLV
ncbi:MAG: 16S rRNA processing protein RimM [Lachnospiraceae bacterium]|nr:16S rRNA processing protein RimM [Lachnospiraceae bacterium]